MPPSAFDISCPPRQWPISGTSLRTASRTNSSSGGIHGSGSFTLIGPPMKAMPENSRTFFGTGSPVSIAISVQGSALRSRYVAK